MLIVGGGLAGGLLSLAMRYHHPQLDIRVIEPEGRIGGNHLWSFFDSDIDEVERSWLAPAISAHWDGYEVRFPRRQRSLGTGYNSILSEQLDSAVRAAIGEASIICGSAVSVGATTVQLADQQRFSARAVVDARGSGDVAQLKGGWQKFVGQMVETARPHGLTRPIIMDATVAQIDGFRFVYVLPFGPDRLFVEDTYYSENPALDVTAVVSQLNAFLEQRGWTPSRVIRQEKGVLPVVYGGDRESYVARADRDADVAIIGAGAALFQPVTSYTLPDAVRTASAIAAAWPTEGPALGALTARASAVQWAGGGFYRLLNRMLFLAAQPEERYRVLEHFYRLPQPLIERFYAGKTTKMDRMRILSGRPPVSITAALKAISGHI